MTEHDRYINCPHCGQKVPVANRLGRKPLNIGVKNIYDTLKECRDITLTAEKLGCSRAYIYRELAKHAITPREVMQRK